MPKAQELNAVPDHASANTSHSRLSIVATVRRKTSRLFGRNAANINAADTIPQLGQSESLNSGRGWFISVGARFHGRHDDTALELSKSPQEPHMELQESSGTTNSPYSPNTPSSRPPVRRRLFRGRLRLHSLPAKFRRRKIALPSRSRSPSNEDKENFLVMTAPTVRPADAPNAGSWSSFRSGAQKAVRSEWFYVPASLTIRL